MFSSELVNHWFYNLINNKKNNEILLLVLNHANAFEKKFEDFFSKAEIENYELVKIESITSISEVANNKNTILLGQPHMNIDLLKNLQHCVLYAFWEGSYESFLSREHIEYMRRCSGEVSISVEDRYSYFFERRNPIVLLNQLNRKLILDPTNSLQIYSPQKTPFNFTTQIFTHDFTHRYKGKYYMNTWENCIYNDIFHLIHSQILTARLAIFIYKITTFKIDDSYTLIGNYYRQKLGVKSKTVRLPLKIYMLGTTTKAYDLTDYFDSVKLESRYQR